MHHVIIIVISAMLTLCYFIMSHATLIYQASMLTLHTTLISHAFWLPQACHLERLECSLAILSLVVS